VTTVAPASSRDVVDVLGLYFDLPGWEVYLDHFVERAPSYLHKFAARFCDIAGAKEEKFQELFSRSPAEAVAYLVDCRGAFVQSFEDYQAQIASWGFTHQILHGLPKKDRTGRTLNEQVAGYARRAPRMFSAWAGLLVNDAKAAARELEHGVKSLGMTGGTITPMLDGVSASDASLKPVYDMAVALDVPLWIHAGHNFNTRATLEQSHVSHIDAVARAYPSLRIVIGHAGWPWMHYVVALCQRHANVYLETSSHRPRLMPKAGSGWEPMLLHAPGVLRDRVMFGTTAWVSPKTGAELAQEMRDLPIPPEVAECWLSKNARHALNLEERCK
jgi:predicted TIM-barrel fold metal-dependent hydrolase